MELYRIYASRIEKRNGRHYLMLFLDGFAESMKYLRGVNRARSPTIIDALSVGHAKMSRIS